MTPETEVIFQNDGTVILQTDGGYATLLKTSASAAWESVRAIRGSDPDNGWASNSPEYRIDPNDPGFRAQNKIFLSNQKQRFWSPAYPSQAAVKCRREFFQFYNHLVNTPVQLLSACEQGNARAVRSYLRDMPDTEIYEFFRITNALAFSAEVKLAAVTEFAKRPFAPGQNQAPIRATEVQR